MDSRTKEIQTSWDDRQQLMGNNIQSVLYKNLPGPINQRLHRKHMEFILHAVKPDHYKFLDVGCGYGRISSEIMSKRSDVKIQGVELCQAYAEKFREDIGSCFHGTLQEYQPEDKFDVIIIVTVLMYAGTEELPGIIDKLWNALNPGGRIICIEQSMNLLIKLRQAMKNRHFEPTGGDVIYFAKEELEKKFSHLTGLHKIDSRAFGMLPLLNLPTMHNGFVFEKITN